MTYTTDNIAIAAGLKLLGHRIKQVHIHDRHGTFVFESGADDAEDILKGAARFPAVPLHTEIRALSGLLRSMVNSKE